MEPKTPLDQLHADFMPIGLGIMEYYAQKFSECAFSTSIGTMEEIIKEEYCQEMRVSIATQFETLSAGLHDKLNLTFFHALLAVLTGRIKDLGQFEQGLALLLRETLLKK